MLAKKTRCIDLPHLAFVRTLPSCIDGGSPCVPHHLLSVPGERGVAQKAGDCWTVPLTWEQHDELHRECGAKTEREWFSSRGVYGVHLLAERLYKNKNDRPVCLLLLDFHKLVDAVL